MDVHTLSFVLFALLMATPAARLDALNREKDELKARIKDMRVRTCKDRPGLRQTSHTHQPFVSMWDFCSASDCE